MEPSSDLTEDVGIRSSMDLPCQGDQMHHCHGPRKMRIECPVEDSVSHE